jgi:cytochrome c biogenesis protein CcmG/thiol:disulfide interchange protein DsbE
VTRSDRPGGATSRGRPGPAAATVRPHRSATRRWLTSPMAVVLAAGMTACTAEATTAPQASEQASPFADCGVLAVPPASGAAVPPSAAAARAADLPDLRLPCFTGGRQVRLADLRGPAVINLWASWCPPCREELPAMQRLADATAGRLHVIGVDSGDDRDAAVSFAAGSGVTLPTLYDRDKKLGAALGRFAIPVTVFVDAAGRRHVYDAIPPDDTQLADLVLRNTGVTVHQ